MDKKRKEKKNNCPKEYEYRKKSFNWSSTQCCDLFSFFFVVVAVKTFILIFFSLNHEDFQNKYR